MSCMKEYLMLTTEGEFIELNEEDYDSTYDMLHTCVDGRIECVSWLPISFKRNIDIWLNEEGKIIDLEPSLVILNDDRTIADMFMGNIVFARNDEEGNTIPLNEEDFDYIKKEIFSLNICVNDLDENVDIFQIPAMRL